jgi:hypothetical protein
MEGGRSAWLKAVMAAKKPGMSLGDAMKAAKKTYKKGGTLMGNMPPMGGRRRRGSKKAPKVGGTAYGFTGGPYTGSDLPDGMSRFPALADATWKGPSELLGGRRPRRLTKKQKKALKALKLGGDGSQLAPVSTDGAPAELPYAEPSVATPTPQTVGPVAPAPTGGRRKRRNTKKTGRGYY